MQNVGFTNSLLKQCFAHAETPFGQTRNVKQFTCFFVGQGMLPIVIWRAQSWISLSFYRKMHYSAKRGLACHLSIPLSVCPSVTLVDQDHIS